MGPLSTRTRKRGLRFSRFVRRSFCVAFAGGFAAFAVAAQEGSPPAARDSRLDELERLNRELRARLEALERARRAPDPRTDPQDEEKAGSLDGTAFAGPGLAVRYADVRATFQFFGDVGFGSRSPARPGEGNASFALGTAGLFATVQMGERFQVLSETILEAGEVDTVIDLERLWGSWTFDDRLYARFGVEHSPTSYWNRLYHHGKWLFPTVDRPATAQFEDDEAILPVHYAGLELGGAASTCLGRLEWVGVVSNGRAPAADRREVFSDRNDAKALDLGFGLAPSGLEPLRFGALIHVDKIPPNPANPSQPRPIRERIESAHADFRSGALEILAEASWIGHEDLATGQRYRHRAGYLQVAYEIGDWTPYTRFDARSMRLGDPFFAGDLASDPLDRDLDRRVHLFGVRYDLHVNAAAKFEVGLGREERRDSSGSVSRGSATSFAMQLAWTF